MGILSLANFNCSKKFPFLFFLSLSIGTLLGIPACTYTLRSMEGNAISAQQIQEIKLGKTTETDLLRLLGPPSKKEHRTDGTDRLLYVHSQVKSPTLIGGFVIYGLVDKEEEEVFEVILKSGVVQSFHFIQP